MFYLKSNFFTTTSLHLCLYLHKCSRIPQKSYNVFKNARLYMSRYRKYFKCPCRSTTICLWFQYLFYKLMIIVIPEYNHICSKAHDNYKITVQKPIILTIIFV